MTEKKKTGWKVTAGAIVLSLVSSAIYDLIKSQPMLTGLASVVKFIWKYLLLFLTLDVKVWWILVAICLLFLVLWVVSKLSTTEEPVQAAGPPWLNYTQDTFDTPYLFKWKYEYQYDRTYSITNIQVYCPKDNCLIYKNRCPVCFEYFPVGVIDIDEIRIKIQHRAENGLYQQR